MYATYIFDLDGTLLDTLGDLAAAVNHALRSNGMPERTIDEVRCFVGNGVRRLMQRAVPDGEANPLLASALETFKAYYLEHQLDTTRPYPGIMEMLRALRQRGCQIAVVSNKFQTATEELCRHFFADTVEVAIGENEAAGIHRKPAPDTVLEVLRRLHQRPAVYVGDSDVDILTARNAHLPCISVLWGFRSREFLLQHGATCLVERPGALAGLNDN